MNFYMFSRIAYALIIMIILVASSTVSRANEKGLVYDQKIGQYKDLSYEVLSEKGLTWKERVQLFGGETVHYETLTDRERLDKQKELKELLLAIKIRETSKWADFGLANSVEKEILNWLNSRIKEVPKKYSESDIYSIRSGAVLYFRAYEIFGDKIILRPV